MLKAPIDWAIRSSFSEIRSGSIRWPQRLSSFNNFDPVEWWTVVVTTWFNWDNHSARAMLVAKTDFDSVNDWSVYCILWRGKEKDCSVDVKTTCSRASDNEVMSLLNVFKETYLTVLNLNVKKTLILANWSYYILKLFLLANNKS